MSNKNVHSPNHIEAALYVLVQLCGLFLASILASLVTSASSLEFYRATPHPIPFPSVTVGKEASLLLSYSGAFGMEVLLSFFAALSYVGSCIDERRQPNVAGFAVGFTYVLGVLFASPLEGSPGIAYSLNEHPATELELEYTKKASGNLQRHCSVHQHSSYEELEVRGKGDGHCYSPNSGMLKATGQGINTPDTSDNEGHDSYGPNRINLEEQLEGPFPIDAKQILLRGSIVRNTLWTVGIVVYTGTETKVMQNTRETPSKASHLQSVVNKALIIVFIAQFVVVTLCDVLVNVWKEENVGDNPQRLWYLYPVGSVGDSFDMPPLIAYWLTYFILYGNLIPICLYVTLEFCNQIQAKFINSDLEMYHADIDAPTLCRSSNLVQELGQVEYIFSDKTGTLTQNVMQFKACMVRGYEKITGSDVGEDEPFNQEDTDNIISEKDKTAEQLQMFLLTMAVAHTVTVTTIESKVEGGEPTYKYNAKSPDEKALVEGAAACGVRFVRREGDVIVVEGDFSTQLQALGMWEWAVYVALHLKDDEQRMLVKVLYNMIHLLYTKITVQKNYIATHCLEVIVVLEMNM
eukprot:g720.t1